ncbi:MAG: hypothetical protein F6K26_42765 [Moorea sp. SIO2I5]|nr:hypothetical protein [Moorena sp. SIO2I5]
MFGYTGDQQQITIDPTTGAGSFSQNVVGGVGMLFGAAAAVPGTTVPSGTLAKIKPKYSPS